MKQKKCKECKEPFAPQRPLQYLCSPLCASKYVRAEKEKKARKEWAQEKRVLKEKIKTLSDYEAEAKAVFQKWIRFRDKDLPCISCSNLSNRYDGGHYFDAGVYSGLIFHEWNCNKQCSNFCNRMNHGNKINYRIGLVKKIGEENVKWLEENKDRLRNYKYSKSELIEIKKKYQQKLKELQNGIPG